MDVGPGNRTAEDGAATQPWVLSREQMPGRVRHSSGSGSISCMGFSEKGKKVRC
jgi:hypothetical protein